MAIPTLEFKFIGVDEIRPNPFQPREAFPRETLQELAESIKAGNVIQPIIVRQHGKTYQIIAGERRWRASQMAGLKQIPAMVKDIAEERVLLESVIENLHRLDLTDIERENAIYELWKNREVLGFKTKAELARAIGVTETRVTSDIEAKEFREKVSVDRQTSTEAIRASRTLPLEERKRVIEKVSKGEMGVREVWTISKVLRKASEPIKKEILKPKSRITTKMAETIVTKLPDEEEQKTVVEEIERYRLTEEEVEDRVRDIQRSKEQGITPTVERPPPLVKGQWLVDRIEKPAQQLLTINIEAFTELNRDQKERLVDLLLNLQKKIQVWILRLQGSKTLEKFR